MKKEGLVYISISMILAVLILYYSIIPPSEKVEKKVSINLDKIKHFIAYALLSFFLYKAELPKNHSFLIAGTYGLLIEILQLGLPSRVFDPFDVIVNYLGSGIVLFLSKNGKRIAGKL